MEGHEPKVVMVQELGHLLVPRLITVNEAMGKILNHLQDRQSAAVVIANDSGSTDHCADPFTSMHSCVPQDDRLLPWAIRLTPEVEGENTPSLIRFT